jgi:hypothetical protein
VKRHDLDLFSLVAGLVFLAVAVGHLLDVASGLDVNGQYVAPVALVTIGIASLAAVLRNGDRTEPVAEPVADEAPGDD